MDINIPPEVESQLEEGERVVGYMKNLFQEQIFFTKNGCSTKDGCNNYIFHEGSSYERTNVKDLKGSSFTASEKHFIKAFLWN